MMYQRPATLPEQMNGIIGAAMSLMAIGGLLALVRSVAKDPSPLNLSRGLMQVVLAQTVSPEATIPDLLERLRAAGDELGDMSLVELVGRAPAGRLARITAGELRPDLPWGADREETDALREDPFSTVESWLEPGGYANRYGALRGVAQAVVEAAEARIEKARLALSPEAIADINYRISRLTTYGLRQEVAKAPGTVIAWSNASAGWYDARAVRKGERLILDANQAFVPYPRRAVAAVLHKLEPLPLYKGSFEAISRKKAQALTLGLEGRIESDERWLEALQRLGLEVYVEPGYQGSIPAARIADVPGLEHVGGGALAGSTKVYVLRPNPETGTRFYVAHRRAGTL